MASLIPGYEYDIFISYRQKDNKGDRWVSEFVEALRTELESTFKEEIRVYFDINPHDGLLETHDVDASLKEKLKCLVFIPVISRTYCDPKSFAWQHEFCVFNKMAREDPFGLDVKLRGGNVASRILPVKINDLDPEDNEMLEKELGGFLRAIDFIYKEPGVNRPLTIDDDPKSNLNRTSYRNQINKVANAIKEIIRAMRSPIKADGLDVDKIIRPEKKSRKEKIIKQSVFAALILALIFAVFFIIPALLKKEPDVREAMDKSIAVLPFQNLSAESEHAYFAVGLHDELLTHLSKVAALSLRGRTSVMGYSGTTKSIRQIADELNVGLLVEGSVQVVGGRLRVNVQLINALTDEHMWADSYDRTLDDAFTIQRDIAHQIVAAMDAALGSSERVAMAVVATNNPEAYRLYLQGREYFARPLNWNRPQNVEIAIRLYERAIALDPEFALAYAALSDAHGRMHWWGVDPSPERKALHKEAAETALRLAPDLPQAHLAMGQLYFMAYRDFRRALDAFAVALEGMPNDGEIVGWIGYTHRRLGNWDEVIATYKKATELNPRDVILHYDMGGNNFRFLRRYADAVQAYDRALEFAPDLHEVAISRGWMFVDWQGQLDSLRRALERVPAEQFLRDRVSLLYWQRDADAMLEILNATPVKAFEGQGYIRTKSFLAARAHRLRGDEQMARAAFHDALSIMDSVMVVLPDDFRVHAGRGLALAWLGLADEALREARWLEQSFVYREDLFERLAGLAPIRAEILAHAGKADAALDEIERLLAGPSGLSVNRLRLSPDWDPIRDHPRFKSLLTKYSKR